MTEALGYKILIIDDEEVVRDVLSEILSKQGYIVETSCDGCQALEVIGKQKFDLILADLKMPGLDGIALLDQIARMRTKIATIIMTGHGTVETALAAMKKGAYDYITKPFKVEDILQTVRRALESVRLERENVALRQSLSLYRISEAMSSSLSLDKVLQVVVEAALWEADADSVTLYFKNLKTGRFNKKISLLARNMASSSPGAKVDPEKVLARMKGRTAILLHEDQARGLVHDRLPGRDLVSFLAVPLMVSNSVVGLLNAFSFTGGYHFSEGQSKVLAIIASRAAVQIENAQLHERLKTLHERLKRSVVESIRSFAAAIEAKDSYIHGHSQRVTEYCQSLVRALGFGEPGEELIGQAAMVHDIGKIGMRYESLNKPGKLTPDEWKVIKLHPELGRQILEPMTFFQEIIPVVYHHHERYDGTGYPSGLKGREIPVGSRILTVADAYDAMTSGRPYREARSPREAVEELRKNAGTQFDPDLVEPFAKIVLNPPRSTAKKNGSPS